MVELLKVQQNFKMANNYIYEYSIVHVNNYVVGCLQMSGSVNIYLQTYPPPHACTVCNCCHLFYFILVVLVLFHLGCFTIRSVYHLCCLLLNAVIFYLFFSFVADTCNYVSAKPQHNHPPLAQQEEPL